jgi:choline dehydrogenase
MGTISLKSNDPFDHPIVNPNYFEEEDDIRVLTEGMKLARKVAAASPLKEIVEKEMMCVGCENMNPNSEEYLVHYARSMAATVYHPVASCKMGKSEKDSVVNSKLQVFGVKNLRIVDASVFPDVRKL